MFKIHSALKFTVKNVDILILILHVHIGVPSYHLPKFLLPEGRMRFLLPPTPPHPPTSNYVFKPWFCYCNNWQSFAKRKIDKDVLYTVTVFVILYISSYVGFEQISIWPENLEKLSGRTDMEAGLQVRSNLVNMTIVIFTWKNKNYLYYCSVFYLCT